MHIAGFSFLLFFTISSLTLCMENEYTAESLIKYRRIDVNKILQNNITPKMPEPTCGPCTKNVRTIQQIHSYMKPAVITLAQQLKHELDTFNREYNNTKQLAFVLEGTENAAATLIVCVYHLACYEQDYFLHPEHNIPVSLGTGVTLPVASVGIDDSEQIIAAINRGLIFFNTPFLDLIDTPLIQTASSRTITTPLIMGTGIALGAFLFFTMKSGWRKKIALTLFVGTTLFSLCISQLQWGGCSDATSTALVGMRTGDRTPIKPKNAIQMLGTFLTCPLYIHFDKTQTYSSKTISDFYAAIRTRRNERTFITVSPKTDSHKGTYESIKHMLSRKYLDNVEDGNIYFDDHNITKLNDILPHITCTPLELKERIDANQQNDPIRTSLGIY